VSYNYEPRPYKFKIAAYRPDVTIGYHARYEWDISELSRETAILTSRNTVRTFSYARVSDISKMAACNRMLIWNNVYISLYARQQRNANGYTYVSCFTSAILIWGWCCYHQPPLTSRDVIHFLWRNSITGWNISKISTSFHHAFLSLGILQSAMEISDGQLHDIFNKNEGGGSLFEG